MYKLLACLMLISCVSLNNLNAQTLEADSLALVDLYNECGGENWSGFDTWLNGPLADWEEVTVDSATQRVTHVEFSNMTLVGTFPASLGNIDKMSGKIQLNNQEGLTGELPAAVWNWVDVERFQLKKTGVTSVDYTGIENMVNLTEFNCENTPLSGMVPGVLFTLPSMVKLYFHDSEFDALPPELASSTGLDRLYLNGNHLTSLPDMTGITWKDGAKVRFHNNALTFEDLEPNMGLASDTLVAEFRYSPQATVGVSSNMFPMPGSAVQLTAGVGGSANVYTWIRGVDEVVGETDTLTIDAFDANLNSGKYYALVQNSIVTGLDITTGTTGLFDSPLALDSLALVDLYNDCNGANWDGFETWLNGPVSSWKDVTVDSATQRVTHVEFSRMTLTGTLPSSLGDLDKMGGKIQLNGQEGLTGELPAVVWNWVDVERFQVKFCGFTSMDVTGMENMVNLTEFNSENTPIAGMVPGVIFELPSMEKLYLHDSEFDALPESITSISGYTRLYLNGNHLTEMPDMTGVTWGSGAKVRFHNNGLTFEDLMPNMALASDANVAEFRYSPQAAVGESTTMFPMPGSTVQLTTGVGGMGNSYTWIRGVDEVVGEADTLTIDAFDANTDSGKYFAVVQNAAVPGLDIMTGTTGLYGSALAIDSLALVDLYNDCGGTEWSGFDTWLNGPINTWETVTVDSATQRVTNVGFKDMHLVGALPSSLGDIDQMSGKIEFRDDSLLVGTLPSFLWKWVNVERLQVKFSGYSSIDIEGLENMVNLTEFNTEGSPMEGMVPGAFFTLPSMVKLYFHDGKFASLPPELASASGLDRLYLNGNNFQELPDMSGVVWADGAKVRVQENWLTFEDLESNAVLLQDTLVAEFKYSPQANVGEETTLSPEVGSEVQMVANVGGTANVYSWIKGEDQVGDMDTLTIAAFDDVADAGTYFAIVQNTIVPGLDIMTENTVLLGNPVTADSLALVDLYNDCGGAEWSGFDTWLNGPLNTWETVAVDSASGRVTNVGFKDMHLTGMLPSSLGNLDQMGGKIEFRDDTLLTGNLPSFLWKWVNVERFQIKFSGYTGIDTDGLENMVNLTEFNTEGSPMEGMVPGVIFSLPVIEKLYFHDSEFNALPDELIQTVGLTRLYLNGDNFVSLPDMSGMTWGEGAKVRVQDNFLTFEDLESNVAITEDTLVAEFKYSPQANIGMAQMIDLNSGDTLKLGYEVGGSANMYMWILGEDMVIDGATEANFQIDSVSVDDSGDYKVMIQSTLVPGLDIFSEPQTVLVTPPSGLEEVDFKGLRVLGNPVGENVIITSDEAIQNMYLYDIDGKLLNQKLNVNATNVSMNVTGLTSGIYVLIVSNDSKYQTIKLIKN